jgi:subtilisin family serine protease
MRDRSPGHNRYLQRQIQFIRDTERRPVYDVVVKVRTREEEDPTFIATIAEAMRRRSVSASARDVLPVSKEHLQKGKASAGKAAFATDRGLAVQVARASRSEASLSGLQKNNSDAVRQLLTSKEVRGVTARAAGRGDTRHEVKPVGFWTSSSVVLHVRDEDLPKLVEDVPNIQEVFLNQRLFVPPVVVPKQLPQAVEDNNVSSWGVRTIGALATWGAFGCRGKGVVVGLLDTGVDPEHPDLRGKIARWAEFDRNGKAVRSKPHDTDKHGTHCAGTIVGGNSSGRWIGVAPEAKIAAGMVLNGKEGGTHAQVLAGMEWAINQQVDVISMSLGGLVLGPDVPSTYSKAILSALRTGIPVVTAIGNEGSQTSGSPGNDIFAFAVGATDINNRAAGFSGGRTQIIRESEFFLPEQLPLVYSKPDVSAPGVAVFSSVPANGRKGNWEHLNGTSMATPHVAGAIALLLSGTKIKTGVPANKRAFLIQDLLTGSAEELGEAGQNHRFGFGRIDVLRAIGFAKELGY